jgi:hypothetical protein
MEALGLLMTTWALVSMSPSSFTMKPDPLEEVTGCPVKKSRTPVSCHTVAKPTHSLDSSVYATSLQEVVYNQIINNII